MSPAVAIASAAAGVGAIPDYAAEMDRLAFMLGLLEVIKVLWAGAFGACIGSLVNVLVYRLPLGLDVVSPTSRCPHCQTKLTWRENIPIFGWLLLRGRCRFCSGRISPEYPIVEAFTAALWGVVFMLLYADQGRVLGLALGDFQPEWGRAGFLGTWPVFVAVVGLFSCLIAATLIDARTFHIPMVLTTVPVVLGLAAHAGLGLWKDFAGEEYLPTAQGWSWAIPSPGPHGWGWLGASIGGAIGVIASNLLLRAGIFRPSFADYEQWLASRTPPQSEGVPTADTGPTPENSPGPTDEPAPPASDGAPAEWLEYPHARREMLRELIFLAPPIGLGLLGAALGLRLGAPWTPDAIDGVMQPAASVPLWADALGGTLMGYLLGAGVVWLMRIVGSLAFNKEAMGLGDVHLMGAVGACVGWIDATLAFFGAAFLGVGWAVAAAVSGGRLRRSMPFGPFLAGATVLIWLLKPGVEWLIGRLTGVAGPLDLP